MYSPDEEAAVHTHLISDELPLLVSFSQWSLVPDFSRNHLLTLLLVNVRLSCHILDAL